jgi:DNA-binding NarL/FixJ family response regulator
VSAAEGRIRVLVADDQAIIRDGLVTVLSLLPDIEVVGEAADGEEAVRLARERDPDVVLMDLRMPVLDGAGATARIAQLNPRTAILVLTTFADDDSILAALAAGARGYLTKDAGRADVAAAVRAVAQGQTTFGPDVAAKLVGALTAGPRNPGTGGDPEHPVPTGNPGPTPPGASASTAGSPATQPAIIARRFPELTQREADVLALISRGMNNREIAAELFVSVATVKTHINAIFAKLGIRDRAQAIARVRD